MATINEQRRLILKRSNIPGTIPTVPAVDDIDTFIATDIFKGELFYNIPDNILYTRDNTGIVIVASGGPPVPYVYYTEDTTPGSEYGQIEINDIGLIGRTKVEAGYIRTSASNPTTDAVNIISDVTSAGNPSLAMSTSDSTGISNSVNLTSLNGVEINSYDGLNDNSYVQINYTSAQIQSNNISNSSFVQILPGSIIINSSDGINTKVIEVTPLSVSLTLDSYADDADAGTAGLVTGDMYQTDGTGAAPLNVAGIVMIKQ